MGAIFVTLDVVAIVGGETVVVRGAAVIDAWTVVAAAAVDVGATVVVVVVEAAVVACVGIGDRILFGACDTVDCSSGC